MKTKRFFLGIVLGLMVLLLISCSATLPYLKELPASKKAEANKIYWGIKAIASEEEFKEFESLFTIACNTTFQPNPNHSLGYQPFKEWWYKFWKSRDIDPTTEENEQKMEWGRRVEYAITHYSSPFGPCPWDDRGETYIKFGEADDVEKIITPYMEQEIWHYYSRFLSLVFESSLRTFGFEVKLKFQDAGEIMNASIAWSKVEQAKFAYRPPDLEILPCAMQVVKFRQEVMDSTGKVHSNYDVDINVAIPLKEIGIIADSLDSLYECKLLQRIHIWDASNKNKVVKADTSLITRRLSRGMEKNLLILQKQFELSPGSYTIYFSLQDIISKKFISYTRENYQLVEYADPAMGESISELLLASKIFNIIADSTERDEMFVRNNLVIVPMPSSTFLPNQTIFPYYEIYDLLSDNGKIKILREYYLYYGKNEDEIFTDTLVISGSESDVYFAEGFNAETIISWKNLGKNSRQKIPRYIENGKFKKGEYVLVIRIADLNDKSERNERKTVAGFKII